MLNVFWQPNTAQPLQVGKLTLRGGLQATPREPFAALQGVFADSLPDGWGVLLMDSHLQKHDLSRASGTSLQRLSYIGQRSMGALSYEPAEPDAITNEAIELSELADLAFQLYEGKAKDILPLLLAVGGSSGGAKPKALIGVCGEKICAGAANLPDSYQHWMVKFAPH